MIFVRRFDILLYELIILDHFNVKTNILFCRERGARALEQRLAAEKSSSSETTEELSVKGVEIV